MVFPNHGRTCLALTAYLNLSHLEVTVAGVEAATNVLGSPADGGIVVQVHALDQT